MRFLSFARPMLGVLVMLTSGFNGLPNAQTYVL